MSDFWRSGWGLLGSTHIFNCCPGLWYKVANLTSSINAPSNAWVSIIISGSDCDSIHPALNYVFISFAVNRKLRHTHGSEVNKWPPFHYSNCCLSLSLRLSPLLSFSSRSAPPLQVAETSYTQRKNRNKNHSYIYETWTVRASDCPLPRPKNNRQQKLNKKLFKKKSFFN